MFRSVSSNETCNRKYLLPPVTAKRVWLVTFCNCDILRWFLLESDVWKKKKKARYSSYNAAIHHVITYRWISSSYCMIRMHKMSTTHVACFLLLVIMTISGFVEAFFFSSTKTGYQQQDTVNILFGSCNSLNRDVPPTSLWNDMKTFNSSLLILGGDNIYTDHFNTQPAVLLRSLYKRTLPFVSASLEDIKREYSKLKKVESFQQLLGTGIELMAIYDDHDYGMWEKSIDICANLPCVICLQRHEWRRSTFCFTRGKQKAFIEWIVERPFGWCSIHAERWSVSY